MLAADQVLAEAARMGEDVASKWADSVDRDARFPAEAVAELRSGGLLGALVPERWGGAGVSIAQMGQAVTTLSRHCASTGLVLAMHQIQVACLIEHATDAMRDALLPAVAAGDVLIANANSEVGLGGERRQSSCALEPIEGGFRLDKQASTVSYGEFADVVTATARRRPDSLPQDQVLAICARPNMTLTPAGEWDTLGLRGTCSKPGHLVAEVAPDMILDDYGNVFVSTSLPVSIVLLSSVWLGIGEEAARRAHASVRSKARKSIASGQSAASDQTPSMSGFRLAELSTVLYQFRDAIEVAAAEYESRKGTARVEEPAFLARLDAVKLVSSAHVVDIVVKAMAICGLPSYQNGSAVSLSRLVRDALAAPLMINNDRVLQASARTMLLRKDI